MYFFFLAFDNFSYGIRCSDVVCFIRCRSTGNGPLLLGKIVLWNFELLVTLSIFLFLDAAYKGTVHFRFRFSFFIQASQYKCTLHDGCYL